MGLKIILWELGHSYSAFVLNTFGLIINSCMILNIFHNIFLFV